MKARKVAADTGDLLDPRNPAWKRAEAVILKMETPPLGNVPSNYFRAMDPTKIGAVKRIEVRALHNGRALLFRLSWEDKNRDMDADAPGRFRDGAGVLFPFLEHARIQNMGSKNEPVNAWCWQAGVEKPRNVTAAGLGTSKREENSYCLANALWENERWALVIGRPFNTPEPELNVHLEPGMKKKVGFAVWEGSNGERAGAKSFCGNWNEVVIEK